MADNDKPSLSDLPTGPAGGDDPLSFDEGVVELEDLIDPDENADQSESKDNEQKTEVDAEASDEGEAEAESQETDETAEDDTDESEEQDPENTDVLAWADDLEVEVEGEVTTLGKIVNDRVQERAKDFQRDYTRKTTEVAEKTKKVQEQESRVMQYIENSLQDKEAYKAFQDQFTPDPPDLELASTDPDRYTHEKAIYDAWDSQMRSFNEGIARQRQIVDQQKQRQQQEYLSTQRAQMVELHPDLADESGFSAFKAELGEHFVPHYGYSAEDLDSITDVRFIQLAKDAMAYRKLQGSQESTKAKLEGKPKVLKPKARQSNTAKRASRDKAKHDRLSQTGDLDAAIDVLMDFDL